jgi:hypothetical protein
MISSMSLYYNHYMLEQFRLELRTNMNTNTLKNAHLQLVQLIFLSFIASVYHIKLQKYRKLF